MVGDAETARRPQRVRVVRSSEACRFRACQTCKSVKRCNCLMSLVECPWSSHVYAWWFEGFLAQRSFWVEASGVKRVCCKRFLLWKGGLSEQKTPSQYQFADCKQEFAQSRARQALGTWQTCIQSSTTILWDLKVYKNLTHITWHNPGHSFCWRHCILKLFANRQQVSNDLKPWTSRHDIKSSIMINYLEA